MSEHPNVLRREAATTIDVRLIDRVAGGDRDAIAELYDRHGTRVYALAHRILGNSSDAEDVVQDVFSQAWRKAASYQADRGPVVAWLLVITRTRALDRVRARKPFAQREQSLDGVDSPTLASTAAPPADELIAREEAGRVRAAVMQLPVEQRRALELAYFDGLSQTEIAAKLQTPLGTVKTRIRTALATLRRSFHA